MKDVRHTPVLAQEALELFEAGSDDVLLDCTLGLGGHAEAFLKVTEPNGRVVGIEADRETFEIAKSNLREYGSRVVYLEGNFANLREVLRLKDSANGGGIVESNIPSKFSYILFDLGYNSYQMDGGMPGLSFDGEAEPRMLYSERWRLPASYLNEVNALTERLGFYPDVPELLEYLDVNDLREIVRLYGEERYAGRIARSIKAAEIVTAKDLADAVAESVPSNYERRRIHPATRTFQALRLVVNRELESLEAALPQTLDLLREGGVLAVISFHSLEDRIVKRFIKSGGLEVMTKKPITVSEDELKRNPRARSAKLRAGVVRNTEI